MSLRLEPVWLDARLALAIHDRQLAEHGGPSGVREPGAMESALARPRYRWEYGEDDPCALASAYAFGVARNHPFTDGNKRTAWVLARAFLLLNSVELAFPPEAAVSTVQTLTAGELTAGELTEDELADWFRQHVSAV